MDSISQPSIYDWERKDFLYRISSIMRWKWSGRLTSFSIIWLLRRGSIHPCLHWNWASFLPWIEEKRISLIYERKANRAQVCCSFSHSLLSPLVMTKSNSFNRQGSIGRDGFDPWWEGRAWVKDLVFYLGSGWNRGGSDLHWQLKRGRGPSDFQ